MNRTDVDTYAAGDAITLRRHAAIALAGLADVNGVIENVVTDTPPDPERGPLYHIRITTPGVAGHFDMGVTRNYADEIQPFTPEPPHDGEQLGSFVFDLRHVTAGHSGLWVYPADYDDAQLCQRRADHLSECFGVRFYAVPLKRIGDATEWYAATGASNTAALRRIIWRAMARAAALRGPDGEVRP